MKKTLVAIAVIMGIVAVSCTKSDSLNSTLKQSINSGVSAVNSAVSSISSTTGYSVISGNSVALKSGEFYTDSITLDSVAGVYVYQPDLVHYYDFFIPHRLFVKKGTSTDLIVKLPSKLVIHPRYMRELNPADTLLTNNFMIDANDYYYYFNYSSAYNYRLKADLKLDSVSIGTMQIEANADVNNGSNSSSSYVFPDGYKISVSTVNSDTIVKTFTLSKDNQTLMSETVVSKTPVEGMMGMGPHDPFHQREKLYTLTIGDVQIRRGGGLDSIQVYLAGVLQQHAAVKIIDSTDTDGSMFHRRDLLLTFDDGTTTNLSTLIDPAKDALKTLVDALRSMNFSKNIVDYIAIGIDFHRHHNHL